MLPLLGTAALLVAGVSSQAQIERLDLNQMVQKTDDALYAEIISTEVIRIDHPIDGPELYYTHITMEGTSLVTGETETVIVTINGGFIDDTNGSWNSEAPSADDIKIGNKVVTFYKHLDNAGGDLECNYIYAGHGGLFRTVDSPKGTVVMGRGDGYAIQHNTSMDDLITAIETVKEKR